MTEQDHFTSVHFHNYKAFKEYSLSLNKFNILVGPNNAGKSTVLGVFRILSEALRKARSRNPELVNGPDGITKGYNVELGNALIATENVFYNYDDSEPASVRFKISNKNELLLYFPERNACTLICKTTGRAVSSPASFKSNFNVSIGFVPILGPVEPEEQLYQKEAARLALLSHVAARNFRNIWFHYPEDFDDFRGLVKTIWPGMDIDRPEIDTSPAKSLLRMFCPEERIPREIFWSGFGFQVWCQMLTFIIKSKTSSLFIIDEPDIYLHSDLQRQLLAILKTLGPDILLATHSTEIIAEADPDDILLVNKKIRWAKRIKDPTQLQGVFGVLGSNLNPTLTQLAKTKRALFVEGKDFQVFSRFARKLGFNEVANRSDFAVIPVQGFNPAKVRDFKEGIEATLGASVAAGVIFDRDYRSDRECKEEIKALEKFCNFTHIHARKELENFVLVPTEMQRAIEMKLEEQAGRTETKRIFQEDITALLTDLTDPLKYKVQSQYLTRQRRYERSKNSGVDLSTIDENLMPKFDQAWENVELRCNLVSGKQILADLNTFLQENYQVTVSVPFIISCMQRSEIPEEMKQLIETVDGFRRASPLQ